MSRHSQLPPRAPIQRKFIAHLVNEPNASSSPQVNELSSRHQKSFSQSSMLEEQPEWLDDLLSDSDPSSKRIFHCRSASDSVTLLDDLFSQTILTSSSNDEESSVDGGGSALESSSMYGPYSPRQKANVEFSDNPVFSVLSDYVTRTPIRLGEEIAWRSIDANFDSKEGASGSTNELIVEPKHGKRHPGQRSRARKLQYISELERNVNVLQAMESELTCRISNLLQQRFELSMENTELKQQMASLWRRKLTLDGEYRCLKKEAEKLKLGLASTRKGRSGSYSGSINCDASECSWQMLEWTKLNLD